MSDFTYLKNVFDDFLREANLVRYKNDFWGPILNRKLSDITLTDLKNIGLLQFHQKRFIRNAKKLSKEKEGQINLYFSKKRHKELLEEARHTALQREQDARKIKENRDKFFSVRAEEDAQSAKRTAKVIKLPVDEGDEWRYKYPILHLPVRHPREIRARPSDPFGHKKKKKSKKGEKGKKGKKSKNSKKGKKGKKGKKSKNSKRNR